MELQVQVTVDSELELELSSWNLSSSQSHTKLDPAGPAHACIVRVKCTLSHWHGAPFTEDSSHGGPTVYRHGDSTVTGSR